MCVCVCVCARACVCVCVWAYLCKLLWVVHSIKHLGLDTPC